jgi:hypothetical protein
MKDYERSLVEALSLLTIVISLSSVGSMYVYYIGTFDTFAIPLIVHQGIIVVLGALSFIYLAYALYVYHRKRIRK